MLPPIVVVLVVQHPADILDCTSCRRSEPPPVQPGIGGRPLPTPLVTTVNVAALERIVTPLLPKVAVRKQQSQHAGQAWGYEAHGT